MNHRKPVADLRDLVSELRPGQRLMGLDLGSKTIGAALWISDSGVASWCTLGPTGLPWESWPGRGC